MPIGRARASKPVRQTQFFGRAHFVLSKRQKPVGLQVFSKISKTMKKTVNPKYYHKHHCTCNTHKVYLSDGVKTALFAHGLGNI